MTESPKRAMRDVLLEHLIQDMAQNDRIYFLSADFGSPVLDRLRAQFPNRFKSVGIAEQNLVNIAMGLALEGFTVFAYAIAPFLSMRAYEQIRTNLSLHARFKTLNINLVGVGTGLSYDISGPSHHCLEDISAMRLLPGIEVISPCDWKSMQQLAPYCLQVKQPKYLRLDSKPLPAIYADDQSLDLQKGFTKFAIGDRVCLVSTGYMTHTAFRVREMLAAKGVNAGIIDLFLLQGYDEERLAAALKPYSCIATLEEAFILRGGMDALIANVLMRGHSNVHNSPFTIDHSQFPAALLRFGIRGTHVFEGGGREYLHHAHGIDAEQIAQAIEKAVTTI